MGDFVIEAATIPPADVVVMHRVVCCYDADRLMSAAAGRSRRYLLVTLPVDRPYMRLAIALINAVFFVRRIAFRSYLQPMSVVLGAAERAGLGPVARQRGLLWEVTALARSRELRGAALPE